MVSSKPGVLRVLFLPFAKVPNPFTTFPVQQVPFNFTPLNKPDSYLSYNIIFFFLFLLGWIYFSPVNVKTIKPNSFLFGFKFSPLPYYDYWIILCRFLCWVCFHLIWIGYQSQNHLLGISDFLVLVLKCHSIWSDYVHTCFCDLALIVFSLELNLY